VELARSINGVPVRLTDERWEHILTQHPEMDGQRERILETIADPDQVQSGDYGVLLALRRYRRTTLGDKYLTVAYREASADDGFVLTAYLTRRPSARRESVWKRQ
jgi:hypothetical protein